MKLIDDWRVKLNKLWSVRVAIFSALLGVADQILAAFAETSHMPPLVYALLTVAIVVARFIDQTPPPAP